MIKFEEHEGLLFKMLDEPVPLKENDENVLVRFITHGVIGEYVMEHWLDCNQPNVPIYIDDVDSDGDVMIWFDENRNEHHCCPFPMFEIIGTLVKEGSDDWAWYQMMNGEKIMCAGMNSQRFYAIKEGCDYCALYENNGNEVRINTKRTYGEFIEYSKMCSISSWQLYTEPKPKPIFTTGDKVTDGVIDGTIIHIEDAIADVCPSTDEYKIELRNLNHISESPKQDDVEKPLRSMIAEAKAIGKNIRTYYQDIVFTPQALEACLNQGKFRWWNICNWELTTREQNYFPSISTSSDRPKPEPAKEQFEVGDWVEYRLDGDTYYGKICNIRGYVYYLSVTTEEIPKDQARAIMLESIIRKLKPFEVMLDFGSGIKGTVRSCEHDGGCVRVISGDRVIAHIMTDALEQPIRNIVKQLLKAQEEK